MGMTLVFTENGAGSAEAMTNSKETITYNHDDGLDGGSTTTIVDVQTGDDSVPTHPLEETVISLEKLLRPHLHQMCDMTTNVKQLITCLYSNGVISKYQMDDVNNTGSSDYDKCAKLYPMVVAKNEKEELLKALRDSENKPVIQLIDPNYCLTPTVTLTTVTLTQLPESTDCTESTPFLNTNPVLDNQNLVGAVHSVDSEENKETRIPMECVEHEEETETGSPPKKIHEGGCQRRSSCCSNVNGKTAFIFIVALLALHSAGDLVVHLINAFGSAEVTEDQATQNESASADQKHVPTVSTTPTVPDETPQRPFEEGTPTPFDRRARLLERPTGDVVRLIADSTTTKLPPKLPTSNSQIHLTIVLGKQGSDWLSWPLNSNLQNADKVTKLVVIGYYDEIILDHFLEVFVNLAREDLHKVPYEFPQQF